MVLRYSLPHEIWFFTSDSPYYIQCKQNIDMLIMGNTKAIHIPLAGYFILSKA